MTRKIVRWGAALALGLNSTSARAIDACVFQPLYRQVGFESAAPTTSLNGLRTSHYGWGQVRFFTNADSISSPQFYLTDATAREAQSSVPQLLIFGPHVAGPVLPDFVVTVAFPRPVTEASFAFGAPLFSRQNIVARVTPLDAEGFELSFPTSALTNQSAGNYPGGGGQSVPITREGTASISGLTFSGLRIAFEPEGGFFPGFEDPTTETPRDFRFDSLRWTPVPYCCPTDYDGDGTNAVNDIFAYLNAWFAGDRNADPRSDFNLSGTFEAADIFLFLNAWFAGC